MQKELRLFKELFQPFVNLAVLHINHKIDFLNPVIKEVVESLEGKLDFKSFETQKDAKLSASAREYEYIVLSDILSYCPNKDKILKLMYKALENSANIIILEHKQHNNLDEIKALLNQTSFVAINHIELFEEYHLITAKKLHMWGSGL
jgi:tRNA U38,U39,U40 pseudouridine synthase TruA